MESQNFTLNIEVKNDEDKENNYNITVPANVCYKSSTCYIRYTTYNDNSITNELVKISPDNIITIIRTAGNIKNKFEYNINKIYAMIYKTEVGIIDMSIKTTHLNIIKAEDNIDISVKYEIQFDSQTISKINMKMSLIRKEQ